MGPRGNAEGTCKEGSKQVTATERTRETNKGTERGDVNGTRVTVTTFWVGGAGKTGKK